MHLCVCVYSQHEEKEKALKEQLTHLTVLLPTLQVQSNQDIIINKSEDKILLHIYFTIISK